MSTTNAFQLSSNPANLAGIEIVSSAALHLGGPPANLEDFGLNQVALQNVTAAPSTAFEMAEFNK